MVHAVYDHLVAVAVVGVIFVGAVVVLPAMSFGNLQAVDQQQLRNTALNVFNAMILGGGYPTSWGTSSDFKQNDVERFGLALSSSSSFYVLDPDKVRRLVVGNPSGYLEYKTARRLLQLGNYGFCMSIISPFNVTAKDLRQGNDLLFEISVSSHEKTPIPNAHVEATIVYSYKEGSYLTGLAEAENNTDSLGQCTIKKELPPNFSDYVIVLRVTVAGLAVVTTGYMEGSHQHVMNASIVGDNITLSIPEGPGWESDSKGARWVKNVVMVSKDEVWNIYNGTMEEDKITFGLEHWSWSRLFSGLSHLKPMFIVFSLSVPNPRRLVLYVGPYTTARGYWVQDYGSPSVHSQEPVLRLSRSIMIEDMTYIAEMLFWKESP